MVKGRSSSFLGLYKKRKFLETEIYYFVSIKKENIFKKKMVQIWFASVLAPSSAVSCSPCPSCPAQSYFFLLLTNNYKYKFVSTYKRTYEFGSTYQVDRTYQRSYGFGSTYKRTVLVCALFAPRPYLCPSGLRPSGQDRIEQHSLITVRTFLRFVLFFQTNTGFSTVCLKPQALSSLYGL